MATRTFYFNSVLGAGEIIGIRSSDRAFASGDLDAIDTQAMHAVNSIILEIAGPTEGATIIADLMDTVALVTIDPEVGRVAELLAASAIFRRWEQFNLHVAANSDRLQRPDSMRCKDEAREIVRRWTRAKAFLKADGTLRRLGTAAEAGPIVGGPLRNGSYFDPVEYIDPWGIRRNPSVADPYFTAGGG